MRSDFADFVPAAAAAALFLSVAALPGAVQAQVVPNNIPIGTCVTAYGSSGRIVDTVQGGYRIANDADPSGTPFVAAAASTSRAPCKTAAPAPAAQAVQPAVQRPAAVAVRPAAAPPARAAGKSCPASSAAAISGVARTYANLIIGNWAAPAPPGSDGAVTATVESVSVGASRKATFWDKDNASLDPRAPVTPLVVKATMCTDFRTRMDYHQVQENFICYTKAAGGLACGEVAHSGDLPQPRNWSVDK